MLKIVFDKMKGADIKSEDIIQMEMMIESYREKLKWNIWKTNDKDAIINEWGHTFWNSWVQSTLLSRNRKWMTWKAKITNVVTFKF